MILPVFASMCLICGGKIDDGRATPSDGIAFECRKHGAYVVARAALPRFIQLGAASQEAAIERATLFMAKRNGEVIVTALDLSSAMPCAPPMGIKEGFAPNRRT